MKKDFYVGAGPFGLGNRITSICCGYAIAKINDLNPILSWDTTKHCQAGFTDLFEEIEGYEILPSNSKGPKKFVCNNFIDGVGRNRALRLLKQGFNDEFWYFFKEMGKKFKLNKELNYKMPRKLNYVSLHIRMNDGPPTDKDFEMINKIKMANVFLCSDSNSAINKIDRRNIDYWTFSTRRSTGDLGNRDLDSVKEAAIEMFVLSKSKTIYALGKHSTFRNLASLVYDVPVFNIDSGC